MKQILLIIAAVLMTSAVGAQTATTLRGHVTDARNANVARANVALIERSGLRTQTVTDDNGVYTFNNIAPGDYVLEVRASGFVTFTSNVFHVARGEAQSNDVSLAVEGVSESVVITATGTAQRIDEISKAISVVDNTTFESKRELTIAEGLRGIPGIRIQQQGSPGALTRIRLRGQRPFDTAFLFDGLRVRDASDINGSAVPFIADLQPTNLDRVEVLRGSGSSIYGTNAIGGVINLIPTSPGGDRHFEFGFDGGSLALFRERIKGLSGLGKRAGFTFGLSRVDVRHGVDGNDQYGDTVGSGRFQIQVTPSSTLSANFYGTISNARLNDSPFALPAAFRSGKYPRAIEGTTFHADLNNPDEGRRNRLLVTSVRFTDQ